MILAWLSAAIAAPRILDPGTQVRVDEVGRKDAFWRFRGDIEGLVCIVGESGMVRRPGKWWSGALGCNDGQEYFFFQVRVTPGDFGSTIRPALPEPAPPETDPEPAPPPVPLPSPFPSGTRIRLRGLGAADTAAAATGLIGGTCTVTEDLVASGQGFWSGALRCGDAEPRYFYQVQVERFSDGRLRGASVPAGRTVRVEEISSLDRHWRDRERLTGQTCTVLVGPLEPTGDGWYAGRLLCGKDEWQLYQVAVSAVVSP